MASNVPQRRIQRFWLQATDMGLVFQPSLAPVVFSFYGRHGVPYSQDAASLRRASRLARQLARICERPDSLVFMGRLGFPRSPLRSRAVRRPLDELLTEPKEVTQ